MKISRKHACAQAFILALVFAVSAVLPCFAAGVADDTADVSAKSEALGVMTVCSYDADSRTLKVAGTINHKVLTVSKNCRIGLFRVPSWRTATSVIAESEPLAESAMSIRFEFSLECGKAEDIISLYAVALIYPDGSRALIAEPEFPATATANPRKTGFKGVGTDSAAQIAESGAGSVIIDVFLDRLEDGRHSGYLQTVDGMSFYYNRDYVDDLDMRVRSASVAGASVLLRLLVSPADSPDGLPYAASASFGAAYRGVVISDDVSAVTVYAYLSFLSSRYNGSAHGEIDGLVLGFCADQPEKFNFCASTGPMYYEIYARTLAVMGIAAGAGVRLIVPVGDACRADGMPSFLDFAGGVGKYISTHTDLEFTLMVDSTHNAYHLDDSYFDIPIDSGDNTAAVSEPSQKTPDPVPVTSAEEEESSADTDRNDDDEREKLTATTPADGYFAADNTTALVTAIDTLSSAYPAVDREFIWCWTPGEDTSGSALSVLYTYNYMALTAAGAASFILRTDSVRFRTVAHLVKYIDTDAYDADAAYALEVFGADSWEALIPGFSGIGSSGRSIIETALSDAVPAYTGRYTLWNFSSTAGAHGWSAGPGCISLRSVYDNGVGCLKAVLDHESGGAYSDICRVCDPAEPIKYTPMMGFDLSCTGGNDGDIYEVKIAVYSAGTTLEGKALLTEGERQTLYLDVSGLSESGGIDAVRIAARRVSGDGEFALRAYSVGLYSAVHSDRELAELIESARGAGKYTDTSSDSEDYGRLLTAVLLTAASLACGGYAAVLLARHEKRRTDDKEK